ncbi:VanZ family protein [Curtobacterium sp. YC1]|uniref:VanZ family protein n=1 Tax=Curtobacterium sp. YC1 TaxID=2795488 RepID=UPI0018E5525E|nr:VanZ family protein [Curtobacterium sp. YC1]QQD77195.1 VanZ family protein [Curtobacterium sp. YC1]
MLTTLLVQVPWLPFGALVAVVVVAPFLGVLLTRAPKVTLVLTVLALVAVLGLTLYPEAAPSSAVGCTAGLPSLAPTAVESIANVLLFVPVSFLVGIRWARPLLAIIAGVALSAVIEAVQALVVGIGRACDTGDWVTNSIGAVIGGLLALAALALAQRRARVAA